METFTIVPRGNAFSVVATGSTGQCKPVATYPIKQDAMVLANRLEAKAQITAAANIRPVKQFR